MTRLTRRSRYGKPSQDTDAHPLAQLVAPMLRSVWQKGSRGATELWLEMAIAPQHNPNSQC